MEPVIWSERYATGHEGIDTQHRVLFRLLEQARLGIETPKARDYRQIVLDLLKYVIEHFSYESTLMRQCGYPGQEIHQRCHQELTGQAVAFKELIFAGKDARAEFKAFLEGWVKDHIANADVELALYVKKYDVGP